MTYESIDIKTVRKCCKQHSYKGRSGKLYQKCETCPLRRSRMVKDQEITMVCHYKLMQIEEELIDEIDLLLHEEIQHPEEWDNWIMSQDTVE